MTAEQVRCVVWDLDNTLWTGTLSEADACRLRPGVRAVLEKMNDRGILLSIASANDHDRAISLLEKKGLRDLFLHPQITWSSKVRSLQVISEKLNLGLAALGFVDDEPFEREQVRNVLPDVRVYPAGAYRSMVERPEFDPRVVTEESRGRRLKYADAIARRRFEKSSGMSRQEFLEYCQTKLRLRRASQVDAPRILELLQRTHQVNSTGVVHSRDVVAAFLNEPGCRVFVAELADRFVDYGRIGVAMCRRRERAWELVSFLLSCRVLSRGVSGVFLSWVQHQAGLDGALSFRGRYLATGQNQRMEMLYRLSGFELAEELGDGTKIFARPPAAQPVAPAWLTVEEEI